MSHSDWNDETYYYRDGDPPGPRTWRKRTKHLTVTVRQDIADNWSLHVHGLITYSAKLGAIDAEVAKEEALGYLRDLVADLQQEVESL